MPRVITSPGLRYHFLGSPEKAATPETVPFWELSSYIDHAESAGLAAAGYRLQYYQLLAQPFYLAAMVLLAASVSLRFFRFGGVQKIVLGGIGVGCIYGTCLGNALKWFPDRAGLAAGLTAAGFLRGLVSRRLHGVFARLVGVDARHRRRPPRTCESWSA